jgi:hypothetical protein
MIAGRAELVLGLECACCTQMYYPGRAFEDAFDAKILGTDKYVVCAVCGLNVPDSMRSERYKKRWIRATRAHLRTDEFRLLAALSSLTRMQSNEETDRLFNLVLRRLQILYPNRTLPELNEAGEAVRRLMARGQ